MRFPVSGSQFLYSVPRGHTYKSDRHFPCSPMATGLVPCRVREQLLKIPESDDLLPSASLKFWDTLGDGGGQSPRLDVLVWRLFVTSCVAEVDQGHVEGFRSRCLHLLQNTTRVLENHRQPGSGCRGCYSLVKCIEKCIERRLCVLRQLEETTAYNGGMA